MVLVYILFLIPLTTATRRFDGPSYRSNVMEGDKPILRMGPEADDTESDTSDEHRQPSPPTEREAPEPAKNMNQVIKWLVEHFGYDLVAMGRKSNDGVQDKPGLLKAQNENENIEPKTGLQDKPRLLGLPSAPRNENENDEPDSALSNGDKPNEKSNEAPKETEELVSDHDDDIVIQKPKVAGSESPVGPPVESPVDPPVEAPASKETGLRTHKKKHKEEKVDPDWIIDLKDFIKDLTTQYGQHEVLDKTKPVIASLEKKHHMKIKDIDVDEYGEIHITYVDKGKNKKTARKRKDTDHR